MPETTQFPNAGRENAQDNSLKSNFVLQNRYKIIGVIGSGGMGMVYQARDLNFTDVRKLVAIKEMQTNTADPALRSSMLKTFRREANILAALSHPAIPKIFDFFDLNDRAYLVMEYINGSDLEALLTKTRELPIDKVIDWAIELCDVLHFLHTQKPDPIVFRDLKPSNVMIDNLGKVRLIDFGIAKAFVSGVKHTMIGTEGYSAPEQYKGDMTPQSDIYSLGATLHQLLTRKDPRLETPFTFHERPISKFNTSVPANLIQVVERALSFRIEERFASCADMKEALELLKQVPSAPGVLPVQSRPQAATIVQPTETLSPTQNVELSGVQPKWTFSAEDEIRSGPATAGEIVFVGAYDTNMWAVSLNSGELVWKYPTKGGVASTPTVDESNKLVVFGSEDSSIYAVDYRSGRLSWTHQTKDRVRCSPRIEHGHAFIGSDDGKMYALNAGNGRLLWAYDAGAPVRSRPFVTAELVIFGSESGEITAVSLSGNRKWTYRTKRAVMSGPVVDQQEGICYVGSGDGFVYALDANTGFNSWRFRTNGAIYASPSVYKGLIVVPSTDNFIYAINAQTGRERWRFQSDSAFVGAALVHQELVYLGNTNGILYCLSADTGKERWRYKTGRSITSAPLAAAGGTILVTSMDRKLYAFPHIV
ncbi:MAG: serine/threonine-protein kinase [Anaerolineae bacterium]|nr:serine/threonine-protein kinase [Anaerolineae bacterium]NUQ02533.1 serine/threonine-protein kinase [Anaerolineae bacterium]